LKEASKKVPPRKNEFKKALHDISSRPHMRASFVTCPPFIEEYLKLGLQVTFVTWHSLNEEDHHLHSWLVTCQASIREFLKTYKTSHLLVY